MYKMSLIIPVQWQKKAVVAQFSDGLSTVRDSKYEIQILKMSKTRKNEYQS